MGGSKLVMEGATITGSYERLHCPLPYAPLDPQSTHHHLLGNHEQQHWGHVDLQEGPSSYTKSRMKRHMSSPEGREPDYSIEKPAY